MPRAVPKDWRTWAANRGLVRALDAPLPESLLDACDGGHLVGGLSLSTRALPDEVFGAVCEALGPAALALRIEDVRVTRRGGRTSTTLALACGSTRWNLRASTPEALVRALGRALRDAPSVRRCLVLGERDGQLLLWAVPPGEATSLRRLLRSGPPA